MADPSIHVVVFSKDRPLQLHGYLASLFEQWRGAVEVDVLFRADAAHGAAYAEVAHEFRRATWFPETAFAHNLRDIIQTVHAPLTCFGCDDAVFTAPVDADKLLPLFERDPNLLGISFRLGHSIRRGMWGHEMAQPYFRSQPWMVDDRQMPEAPLEWDCAAVGSAGDWAYPWDVVGTVYRTDFVRRMVASLVEAGLAHNPSTLEHYGAQRWPEHAEGATTLRAWHTPRLVLPTVNVVQSVFPNGIVGGADLSPEFLLECWNRGLRLDTKRYALGPQSDTWRVGDFYLRRAA